MLLDLTIDRQQVSQRLARSRQRTVGIWSAFRERASSGPSATACCATWISTRARRHARRQYRSASTSCQGGVQCLSESPCTRVSVKRITARKRLVLKPIANVEVVEPRARSSRKTAPSAQNARKTNFILSPPTGRKTRRIAAVSATYGMSGLAASTRRLFHCVRAIASSGTSDIARSLQPAPPQFRVQHE